MKHTFEIVGTVVASNRRRQILDMGAWEYMYIPITKKEATKLGHTHTVNPCLRIEIEKKIYTCPECGDVSTEFKKAERHLNDCIAWNDERRGSESL